MDWSSIFLNGLDGAMALEIGLRTVIMFTMILVFLRSTGKKGVRQLSIFEIAIIIALGSAAGDPMLSGEAAILPSSIVFLVILLTYRLITYFAVKNQKVENILEGVPQYIIEDGMFTMAEDGDANFARDEFFSEMRVQSVEHIGQIRTAVLETNGQVSFLYYEKDEVKPGLPVFPKAFAKKSKHVAVPGLYACTNCANVMFLDTANQCPRCKQDEWVDAMCTHRIS